MKFCVDGWEPRKRSLSLCLAFLWNNSTTNMKNSPEMFLFAIILCVFLFLASVEQNKHKLEKRHSIAASSSKVPEAPQAFGGRWPWHALGAGA